MQINCLGNVKTVLRLFGYSVLRFRDLRASKTGWCVIIHQPYCLHECVTDGGAYEFEAAALKIFAHCIGFGRPGWQLLRISPLVFLRFASHELPDVGVEAPELFLDGQERFSILNRRRDLQTIADDAGIIEQLLGFFRAVARHLGGVESIEGFPVVLPLSQDGVPTETGLCAFEDQKLEQRAIVVDRDAPLLIVISDGEFLGGPLAAFHHPL